MDVTPQSIRSVQFREKVRGYHPGDVDAFVASVAKAVEELEQRAQRAEARLAEAESRQSGATDAEDSLRRTLVLAQRTADLAIQEAREEAARIQAESTEQRAAAEAELASWRDRLHSEAEEEGRSQRERLVIERRALLADVEALGAHLERERERLRIYFSDQLHRVEAGEPGVAAAPPMQAEIADDDDGLGPDGPTTTFDEAAAAPAEAAAVVEDGAASGDPGAEEDAFLAELRRAVTDDRPLGPRDDEPAPPAAEGDEKDDGFDLFAPGDDDPGRFGSRLRRRR